MILLFLSAFLLVFFHFYKSTLKIRESFIETIIAISLIIFINTEILSLFNALNHSNIIFFWIIFDGGIIFLTKKNFIINIKSLTKDIRNIIYRHKLYSFLALSILILLAFLCYFVPPNNSDSMLYHMARIPFWIYNKNVDFFPTLVGMQLYYNPLAEYQILQTELLTNSIRFANYIQWLAMVGSCTTVSLIVQKMNGNKELQIIAFFLTLTLPMAIFQATSTQNDLVCGFYMITALYYLMKLFKDRFTNRSVILFSISLALCGLTKFSGWIFIFPFLVYFGLKLLFKYKLIFIRSMIIMLFINIVLFLPFIIRNTQTFQSVLGAKNKTELSSNLQNDDYSIKQITTNTIKNIAILSIVPFNKINKLTSKSLMKVYALIGWQLNSEKDIKFGNSFTNRFILHEDSISNFIPFYLFLFSILLLIYYKDKNDIFYFIGLILGLILFSSVIRWQIWNGRLFLPWFLLLMPYLTLVYGKWFVKYKLFRHSLLFVSVLFAYVCVFANPNKLILPIKKSTATVSFLSNNDLQIVKKDMPDLMLTINKQYKPIVFDQLHVYVFDKSFSTSQAFKDSLNEILNYMPKYNIYDKSYIERMYWIDMSYYRMLNILSAKINTKNSNIGLALLRGSNEYFIEYFLTHNAKNVSAIYNVHYPKVLATLPNTKIDFIYQYLITNNSEVIEAIKSEDVEYIYDFGMVYLYKFKSNQNKKYLVKDIFNEVTKNF